MRWARILLILTITPTNRYFSHYKIDLTEIEKEGDEEETVEAEAEAPESAETNVEQVAEEAGDAEQAPEETQEEPGKNSFVYSFINLENSRTNWRGAARSW